jgi:hypothetical protein
MSKKQSQSSKSTPKGKTNPKQPTIEFYNNKKNDSSSDELDTWKEYKGARGLAPLPKIGPALMDLLKKSKPSILRETYANWVKNANGLPEIHVRFQRDDLDTANVSDLIPLDASWLVYFLSDRDAEIEKIKDARNTPYEKNDPHKRPITDHRYVNWLMARKTSNKEKKEDIAKLPTKEDTKSTPKQAKKEPVKVAKESFNPERLLPKQKIDADKKYSNETTIDISTSGTKSFLDITEIQKLINYQEKGQLVKEFISATNMETQPMEINSVEEESGEEEVVISAAKLKTVKYTKSETHETKKETPQQQQKPVKESTAPPPQKKTKPLPKMEIKEERKPSRPMRAQEVPHSIKEMGLTIIPNLVPLLEILQSHGEPKQENNPKVDALIKEPKLANITNLFGNSPDSKKKAENLLITAHLLFSLKDAPKESYKLAISVGTSSISYLTQSSLIVGTLDVPVVMDVNWEFVNCFFTCLHKPNEKREDFEKRVGIIKEKAKDGFSQWMNENTDLVKYFFSLAFETK